MAPFIFCHVVRLFLANVTCFYNSRPAVTIFVLDILKIAIYVQISGRLSLAAIFWRGGYELLICIPAASINGTQTCNSLIKGFPRCLANPPNPLVFPFLVGKNEIVSITPQFSANFKGSATGFRTPSSGGIVDTGRPYDTRKLLRGLYNMYKKRYTSQNKVKHQVLCKAVL